jgi:MoaA/NifB/PqqE/SkfB family radical SAM enzyme
MTRIYDDHVSLFLTNKCPNECSFCLASAGPNKASFMDTSVAIKILNESEAKWKEVSLGGGEPLLHPDVLEILEAAISRGWDVLLHTNLLENLDPIIEALVSSDSSSSLTITASYNNEVSEKMRILGMIEELDRRIKDLDDPRISLRINVLDNAHNNELIDLGFKPQQVVKVPLYSLGRARGAAGSKTIDMGSYTGSIYTTDGRKFEVWQYEEACDHQSSKD